MKRRFTILSAALALLVSLAIPMGMWGQTTVTQTSFSAISGNVNNDAHVSYFAYKGNGTSNPAVNSNAIRLYQNQNGYTGGYVVIGVGDGYEITSATIRSTMATTTGYKLTTTDPGNTTPAKNTFDVNDHSLAANTDYTVSGISTQYITFACFGTTSSSRLYLSKISITYQSTSGSTKYTVTYLANGATSGNVPVDNNEYENNAEVVVLGNTGNLVKTGNSWCGWNTQDDGQGTTYQANGTFHITGNTILYAKWNPNTNSITLPSADIYGTYTMNATNPVAYGTNVTLTYTPATGYEAYAATWSLNGTPINGNMFTMPDEDVTVTVALAEATAEFVDGVYTETMTTQASFDNWRSYSVSGDQCWEFGGSSYGAKISGYVNPTNYENEDWYISPKMQVENGKLDISFACVGRYGEAGMITILYSTNYTGVPSAATWTEITPDQSIPYNASNWNFQNITCNIEQTGNVYFAFKYVSTTEKAGTFEVKNFTAKQYYNVIFDANDENATGTMAPLSCVAGVAKALTENAFEVSGKVFNGWNTQSDGLGTTYADGANISITQNTTLYAQWADVYAMTFMANGNLVDTKNVKQGDPIGTLPTVSASYIPEGYEFMGWHVGDYFSENTAPEYVSASYEPTGDVTLKAVFAQVTSSGSSTGTLTGDEIASEFADPAQAYSDDERTYVDGDFTWVTKCQTNTNRHWIQLRKNDVPSYVKIIAPSDIRNVVVTITSASNSSGGIDNISMHQVFSTNGEIYLNTEANGNTHVGVTSGSAIENNIATIIPSGDHQTLFLQVSTAARIWGITVDCASVSCSNYCTSVNETYTLTIPAFNSQNGGYRLISSPVATATNPTNPGDVTNMITDDDDNNNRTYDLYRFDQDPEDGSGKEWRNYRATNDGFDLEFGKGYLYGNLSEVELVFTGTAYNGDAKVTLTKTDNTSADFPGWNLVGNPFGVNAYIGNRDFYVMEAGSEIILADRVQDGAEYIKPMEGVFVIAANNGEELQFTTTPNGKSSRLGLNLSNGRNVIDRASVRFDEGQQLPKFQLNRNSTKVYIPQDGKDFAVVCAEEMGAMPVNFKAEDNGTYSLNFSCENVEFTYLHLIDNMTGNDVDLLQTPSYSFEAKTTDYESRFKLVFATGDNSNDDTFAFYSNGFVINNEGNATLQVIDITGRIVKSESINGCTNVNVNAAPGVYMLRLINGDNVKVQKVVVK